MLVSPSNHIYRLEAVASLDDKQQRIQGHVIRYYAADTKSQCLDIWVVLQSMFQFRQRRIRIVAQGEE